MFFSGEATGKFSFLHYTCLFMLGQTNPTKLIHCSIHTKKIHKEQRGLLGRKVSSDAGIEDVMTTIHCMQLSNKFL